MDAFLFISELHPFKQYLGSQAKFENSLVDSYTHHISDFISTAKKYNLKYFEIIESFDNNQKESKKNVPRLISILFKKN